MRVIVVEPPAPVVTWEEADAHLKLDGDATQKAEVEAMIASATGHIDGPGGWLGRSIGVQTLEVWFDAFDPAGLRLPYPPIIEIVSVEYLDPNGVVQPLASDDFELLGDLVVPAFNKHWPQAATRAGAIRIRYRAGYEEIPPQIRSAVLLMVGDLYRHRETVAGSNVAMIPSAASVHHLLRTFRVYR